MHFTITAYILGVSAQGVEQVFHYSQGSQAPPHVLVNPKLQLVLRPVSCMVAHSPSVCVCVCVRERVHM